MNEKTGFSFKFKLFGIAESLKNVDDFNGSLIKLKKNLKDFDSKLGPIGSKIEDVFNIQNKAISKPLKDFEKTFVALQKNGGGFFTSVNIAMKETIKGLGGISGTLKFISGLAVGGLLLFLGGEAFKNNIGGLSTAFSKLRGQFSMLFANIRIATREMLRAIEPFIKILVDLASTFLLDVLKGINSLLIAFQKAPKIIKIITGALIGLGIVLWGLSTNPIIIAVTGLIILLLALYKAIKKIVNLFKSNNKLSMDIDTSFNGKDYNLGNIGSQSSSNVDNTKLITNNVYVTGTGYGRQDGRNIAEELSFMSSIRKTM